MNTLELSKMLAYEHFEAEPALTKVAIFTAENAQEIRLLEVNNDAMPSRCVQPFVFRPSIERLVPGKETFGRNAEYSWVNNQGVQTPCLHRFDDVINFLNRNAGRNFLRLVERALFDEKFSACMGID